MKMLSLAALTLCLVFSSCAVLDEARDALLPDEMTIGYHSGTFTKMDKWFNEQNSEVVVYELTWHLRKDERNELRRIRKLLEARITTSKQ